MDDRQTQPGSTDRASSREERLKDPREIVRGNAHSMIANPELISIPFSKFQADLDLASNTVGICITFGVRQKIYQNLGKDATKAQPLLLILSELILQLHRDLIPLETDHNQINRFRHHLGNIKR